MAPMWEGLLEALEFWDPEPQGVRNPLLRHKS